MTLHHLTTLDHPALAPYVRLTEAQLRSRHAPESGVFIAESPKVILTALSRGYRPLSLLCEERHLRLDAAPIVAACPDLEVFTGSRELLSSLTGYTLTRGVLAAMRRPALPSVAEVVAGGRRVVVLEGVVDATNIGAIFRSAAALGMDGALLAPTCCDPLNRRALRVSMGTVLQLPWTWMSGGVAELHEQGFAVAAMALRERSMALDDGRLQTVPRLAIAMGSEGHGLPEAWIEQADFVVRIPMSHGVDSLNVASASALAFWELRPR